MEWKTVKLGEIAIVKGGKRLPKGVALIDKPNQHPYIRIRDIGSSKFIKLNESFQYVDDETQKSISRYITNTNDILLSIVGTIGLVGIVDISLNNANQTENCVKIKVLDTIVRDFLYYYLLSDYGQKEIKKGTVGAVQAKLPLKNILNISLPLPPLETQRRIAAILSSLDDKIENNNRINRNLEAQAQALFKSWFVDFEPWGGIKPEDWREGVLSNIAEYLNGLAMQKYPADDLENSLPVLKIKELGQKHCDENSDRCSKYIKPEYIVNNGDIIFSWSGTLLVDIWCGGICGLNQHLFKVTSNKYPKWFYFLWTKYHLDEFRRIASDKTVTMGHIKRGDLDKAKVYIPEESLLSNMSDTMSPLLDSIVNNSLESQKLAALRDTLLPKLMKGEIAV